MNEQRNTAGRAEHVYCVECRLLCCGGKGERETGHGRRVLIEIESAVGAHVMCFAALSCDWMTF